MNNTVLIILVAVVTMASRLVFMLRPVKNGNLKDNRFLAVFPVALFTTIAVTGLAAPGGEPAVSPALWAGLGGALAGWWFRRSVLAVVVGGMTLYWLMGLLL
jgi:branched-subunit amino acid transport protein